MAIGATTGEVEFLADDIRLETEPVELIPQGSLCSVKVDGKDIARLHRGDKIFLWKEV